MGEVDDVQYAVNQGQSKRNQCIYGTRSDAIEHRRKKDGRIKHSLIAMTLSVQWKNGLNFTVITRNNDLDIALDYLRH